MDDIPEVELHVESEEIKAKPRICVDEDGNPIIWQHEYAPDWPTQYNL